MKYAANRKVFGLGVEFFLEAASFEILSMASRADYTRRLNAVVAATPQFSQMLVAMGVLTISISTRKRVAAS